MIRFFYSLLMWALQPALQAKLRKRGQAEAGYLEAIPERFGLYSQAGATQPNQCVWIHAVSLGETRAAAVLLDELRAALPSVRIVLTHGTATGRAQGQALLREGDVQVWQPWDTPQAVRRFLTHFKPLAGIVLETEVWPNCVHACQQAHIPLLLVNARMSEKSMRKAQRLSWLSRPAYAGLTGVWAQTPTDAQRLQRLGAKMQGVLGNLKFDAHPDAAQLAQALLWKKRLQRPVIILASSREGEEALWLDALQALRDSKLDHQDHLRAAHWLVVPRHPQRFEEVAQEIAQRGWRVLRRSQWSAIGPDIDDANTIWLGDTMGDMALYFGLSDVALLGGSFAPFGGQNLIEATACGCPVVMGPHTFNFEQAAELAQEAGAAERAQDMAHAVTLALQIACSGADENAHVLACAAFSQQHKGAAQRTVQAVLPYLR
jgi:3-deoxy-D-manno-octulosonic-acid transferase